MSTTIDERVVEMRFDNRQFEDGVQTSMSTLERLRKSLNLEGATKGLEAVDEAAKKCKMTPLGDAVDAVKVKFSAMQVVAATAIANITNSAINMGKRLIKSLTVDAISDGFKEYELKMDSVQNIMNGTGESLETVMKYLNELNTYADRTIYSFSDMTSNIGKFTNSGVKLHDAVKAIQGVSNVAAISGANTQQASHAMYNFAQALSSGSVKLIDWKSIENANMATMEFKTELLKTALALGTVKKKGDQYISTTKDQRGKVSAAFDATKNFNESLSSQWMTTEVLVQTLGRYSDETTAIGKKAFAAAQDVKTFSQLMDTLKEAVGSGWSETFELIFGNFEEAKALWTEVSNAVGGVIDKMSKGRNAIFQEWHDLGGRTALIDGIRNSIKGISELMKPIVQAIKEIFPALTGKKLADISKEFSKFTSHFVISERIAARLKSTFKGLFAPIDVVGQALSALLGGAKRLLAPVLGAFLKLSGGVLGVTGRLGDFLTTLDKFLRKNKIFEKAVNKFVDFILAIPPAIDNVMKKITGSSFGEIFAVIAQKWSSAVDVIKSVLGDFRKTGTNALDSIGTKISERFKPMTVVLDSLKKIFTGIKELVSKAMPLVGALAMGFGSILSGIGEALTNFINNTNFDHVLDLVNGGLLVSLGLGIRKFMNNLSDVTGNIADVTENAGGLVGKIKDIFGGVTDCLGTMQDKLKADVLKTIAISVGILTASLFVLSTIDSGKMTAAFGALTGIFIDLFAAMAVYQRMAGAKGILTLSKAARGMIVMSAAVLILSIAVRNLASLNPEQAANGVAAIGALCGILVTSLLAISATVKKFGAVNVTGIAAGLFIISLAVVKMAKSIQILGEMKMVDLSKGMLGMAVAMSTLLGVFVAISATVKGFGKVNMVTVSFGFLVLSSAVLVMAKSIKILGAMKMADLGKGMLGIAVAMSVLVGAFIGIGAAVKKFGTINTAGVAIGLLIMASSLLVLTKSIRILGEMEQDKLIQGLNGAAVSLGLLVSAFIAMSATVSKFGKINVMSIAASILVISSSMLIMSKAIGVMGTMSLADLVKGLAAFAAVLGAIVGTFVLISKFSSGSVIGMAFSILVVASAIAVFTPVLKTLGKMPIWDICKALLAIASVFAILGTAAHFLTPLIPAILSLSGSLFLLGLGLTGIGAGLVLIGAGITSLSISLAAATASIIASLKLIIVGFISLIPDTVKALIPIVPVLMELIKQIILSTCDVIKDCVPELVDTLLVVILDLLKSLSKYGGPIVDYLVIFIIDVINALAKRTPDLLKAIFNFLGSLFSGVMEALGLIDPESVLKAIAGVTLITVLIYALSAIAPMIPGAMAGVLGVGIVIAEMAAVLAAIGALGAIPGVTWLIGKGGDVLQAIGVAIGQFFGGIIGGIAIGATSQLPRMASDISGFMTNLKPFLNEIKSIDKNSLDTISSLAGAILILTSASVLDSLTSWFTGGTSFSKFGDELVAFAPKIVEYANAISELTPDAITSIKASAEAAKALAEFGKTVPNEGGMAAWFAGENSVTKFGDDMVSFGKSLVAYSNAVKGVDAESVKMSAEAGKALAEFGKNVPNEGGMAAWFAGENSVAKFGEGLVLFGANLKSYSFAVKDVSIESIQNSVKAAMALSDVAGTLQNHGGVAAWFAGDNELDVFGESLKSFGSGIATYSVLVTGINVDSIVSSATAAQALSNMAGTLQNHGGVASWFAGDNTISDFGKNLVDFGKSLSSYSSSVANVDASKVQNTADAAKHLGDLDKSVTKSNGQLADLGRSLPALGEGLGLFYSSTIAVSPMRLSLLASELKSLIDMMKSAKGLSKDSMNGFTKSLKTLGETSISKLVETFDNAATKVSSAVTRLINAITSAVKEKQTTVNSAFKTLAEGGAKAIKKEWQKFYNAGIYVAKGFCSGVTSSNTGAIRSGTSLARKALEAARRTLDENSPSKEFYKIGAFAGAGFVNALNDSQKDVDRAGSSFGLASIDALSQTIGRIAEAVDDNIDVQPTITPVLDLSEIQNGRKKLNGIIPKSAVLSAGNSYALASGVLTLLAGGVPSAGRGNISIYNTFNEANNRDGMAIIRQLNREMGAMI